MRTLKINLTQLRNQQTRNFNQILSQSSTRKSTQRQVISKSQNKYKAHNYLPNLTKKYLSSQKRKNHQRRYSTQKQQNYLYEVKHFKAPKYESSMELQAGEKVKPQTQRRAQPELFNNQIIRTRLLQINAHKNSIIGNYVYPLKTEPSQTPTYNSPIMKKKNKSIQEKYQNLQLSQKKDFSKQSLFNEKSTVFFNRSFWKNKQFNKVLHSKVKFLLMNNQSQNKNITRQRVNQIFQEKCFDDSQLIKNNNLTKYIELDDQNDS